MMSGGSIVCDGSYEQCVAASDGKLTLAVQNKESEDDDTTPALGISPGSIDVSSEDTPTALSKKQPTEATTENIEDDSKEASQTGVVKRDTFLNYLRAMPGGLWTGLLMLALFVATQGSLLACIAVVGKWSGLSADGQSSGRIIGLVVGLVVAVSFFAILRAFVYFHLTLYAAKRLHDDMTSSVLRAKVQFFDMNPLGRILNRFSADVGSIDDLLPPALFDFLVILFIVLGGLVSTISLLPATLVFIPPLVWYFVAVRRAFVATSRELKRMEGLARSPIFAMLSESLSGIATIRSNNALEYFQKKFLGVHDVSCVWCSID